MTGVRVLVFVFHFFVFRVVLGDGRRVRIDVVDPVVEKVLGLEIIVGEIHVFVLGENGGWVFFEGGEMDFVGEKTIGDEGWGRRRASGGKWRVRETLWTQ